MTYFKTQNKIPTFLASAFFVFIFLIQVVSAHAAQSVISVEGPKDAALPGSFFTVDILLNTVEPINAIDLEISYSKEELKFISFDNTNSIIDIWRGNQSAPPGTLHLTGGIFKSFTGEKGFIGKIMFQALQVGQPEIGFSKYEVYIADGKGTKLPVDALSYTGSIEKDAKGSAVSDGEEKSKVTDNTPPEIFVEQTISPVDKSNLIVFMASDKESGIAKTQMRVKKWWSYSLWEDVTNPVLYPEGIWSLELRAISNAGLESVKGITSASVLFKKLVMAAIILVLVLVIFWRSVYNRRERKL